MTRKIAILVIVVLDIVTVASFRSAHDRRGSHLSAQFLTSALESLGRERDVLSEKDWLPCLQTYNEVHIESDKSSPSALSVPLYPLPAVYLPTGDATTYTLQNIEPRNIQMALDLAKLEEDSRLFCVTLRAVDTGRLAKVGTLLKVSNMEVKSSNDGEVKKIVLTCVAGRDSVDIVHIENPQATDLAYRLRRPKEYLRAKIRRRGCADNTDDDIGDSQEIAELLSSQIQANFNRVLEFLIEGFGADALPPFARNNLAEALPALDDASRLLLTCGFWEAAFRWQTLAYTLREGYQQKMAGDRNELLIAGAVKQGGPLNLPVHLEDLEPADRQAVVDLEQRIQQEWIGTGLEPVVDFQVLMNATRHIERLELLAAMVARECERLTMIALLPRPVEAVELPEERKGAWFDDDW